MRRTHSQGHGGAVDVSSAWKNAALQSVMRARVRLFFVQVIRSLAESCSISPRIYLLPRLCAAHATRGTL